MQKLNRPRTQRNNIYFGAFLGLIFPVLGFLLYWVLMFSDSMSLPEYWDFLFASKNIAAALSLSILLNLPVFILNISNNNNETVKGVIGATIFYGLLIIIFKFS